MALYRRLIGNHPLANIAFTVVLVLGILAYLTMPREQDPEINFNWVSIIARLPGASAEDVEKRVTAPLEDAIKAVPDVRFSLSSSREHVASILVRFRDIDERLFDKRISDLRREIQNASDTELPPEAKDPRILEITTSNGFPTAMLLVTGRAEDETLRQKVRVLKSDLERITGVDQVFASGLRDPELQVEFAPAALANRGLTGADVAGSVAGWFRDTFAGNAQVGAGDERTAWLVRVVGQSADPDYLARLSAVPTGRAGASVPLEQVAEVSRGRAKATTLASQDGQPAVILSVTKKSRTNTLDLVGEIQRFVAERNTLLAPDGLKVALLDDQTVPTRQAIGVMESNAVLGLALVLLICWLFLGPRIALLVSLGIPFALAGTFAILHALGHTLNISVLLGVVIALGMLVDDAVVVVEAIYYRMQRGAAAMTATLDAIREVFAPVTSSVLTTMSAFLPLMLLPGIVGKFMFVIPFVVFLALAISLFEAYWILPAHVVAMNPRFDGGGRMQRWRNDFNHRLRLRYSRWLLAAMRRPALFLAIALALMAGAGVALGTGAVRTQFFAFDPLRLFYVNVDMPAGSPVDATLAQTERVEQAVRRYLQPDETRAIASYTGIKFTDTEPLYGDAYGQVVVSLKPGGGDRRDVAAVIESMRAEVEALPSPGKISFTMISGGPPLSKPIRVRVRGDEPGQLRAAADALLHVVGAVPGTRDVVDDDVPGRPELALRLDRDAVRAAGLDPATVARLVRLHVDGDVVAVLRDQGEKVEVRVRADRPGVAASAPSGAGPVGADILQLLDDPIALPGGKTTTLANLVDADTRVGAGVIKHYNLRRAITVEADLDKTVTDTVAANRRIAAAWADVAARYPDVSIDFSGELDDIQESLDAMLVLFLMGIGLIYLILATQFRSYGQPLLILASVPLAFTGVILGLLVSRNPLSLYTLYGVIALTGIAVNSAIVLIDAANQRRAAGMSILHAAVYAARRRVVPILITAATTVAGLFSLAFGLGGKSLLWGPVAASIVWGLTFSTILTLFVIPLLYAASENWQARRAQRREARRARTSLTAGTVRT